MSIYLGYTASSSLMDSFISVSKSSNGGEEQVDRTVSRNFRGE